MRPYLDPSDDRYIGGFVDHLVNETSDQITRLTAYLDHGKAEVDKGLPSPFETFYRTYALAERLDFVASDFFTDELPSGEVVAFG
ncbi:hypothetical protein E0H75_40845 [Kribbella capetownensis]|uniref:Uncharacterized protein n=1 Tax=Kribbella capetownensis TaxID=1572659 RepID=A0A4R0J0K0_9ACTN|nr:hypothetical protein [Kribbella capetownensis]TCC37488.1 hypothetical protein E0H75_40845 [Kribbella capetownensis]